MWTIKIPGWCPPSLNRSRGRKWVSSHRATTECEEYVRAYNLTAGTPKVTDTYRPFRTVAIHVTKTGPLPDPDNLAKNLLDGMKHAELLVDDSAVFCKWLPPKLERVKAGARWIGTTITIDDTAPPATLFSTERDGPNFTRAEIDRRPYYAELVGDPADFRLYFDPNDGAGERLFLGYPVCDRLHLARLVEWARAIGVPVIEETVYDAAPVPAKRKQPPATVAGILDAFD